MASQAAFQVLTKQGLSKPYSIPSLLNKKQQGLVHDSSECTSDGGLTYIPLGQLLEISAAARQTKSKKTRPLKPRQLAATSSLQQSSPKAADSSHGSLPDDDDHQTTYPLASDQAAVDVHEIPQETAGEAKPRRRRLPLQLPPPSEYALADHPVLADSPSSSTHPDPSVTEPKRRKLPLQIPAPAEHPTAGYALVGDTPQTTTYGERTSDVPAPEFEVPKRSSVAEAAAAAMLAAEKAAQKQQAGRHHDLDSDHRQQTDVFSNDDDDEPGDLDRPPKRSVLKTMATLVIIFTGLAATGLMVWQHFDKENSFDILAITDAQIAALQDSTNNPATLEELSARTQIMSLQLRQLSRAVGRQDSIASPAAPIELTESAPPATLPLLPYAPVRLSPDQQADSAAKLSRYAKFVREQGPDGRQLDQTSVELYSRHLRDVMQHVSGTTKTRVEALHELAELAKVLYLLQLGNITSEDPGRHEDAKMLILNSTNAGLQTLFAELATGDMRFYEVFQAAEPGEQTELLLIRYLFHRASSPAAADAWVNEILTRMDESQQAIVRQSITEANGIER